MKIGWGGSTRTIIDRVRAGFPTIERHPRRNWLIEIDSNDHRLIQSQECCHCTINQQKIGRATPAVFVRFTASVSSFPCATVNLLLGRPVRKLVPYRGVEPAISRASNEGTTVVLTRDGGECQSRTDLCLSTYHRFRNDYQPFSAILQMAGW